MKNNFYGLFGYLSEDAARRHPEQWVIVTYRTQRDDLPFGCWTNNEDHMVEFEVARKITPENMTPQEKLMSKVLFQHNN